MATSSSREHSNAVRMMPMDEYSNHSTTYETVDNSSNKANWNMPFLGRRFTQTQPDAEAGHHIYRNVWGTEYKQKNHTGERYLSRTRFRPRRLRVQASQYGVLPEHPDWKRLKIKGSVPRALVWSEWILAPGFPKERGKTEVNWQGVPKTFFYTLLFALPLQLYLSFPFSILPWDEDEADEAYLDWPGYLWTWPVYAVNPLDMSPNSPENEVRKISARTRLLRPRLLMVEENGKWSLRDLDSDPLAWKPYVMVSYTNIHFNTNRRYTDGMSIDEKRGVDTAADNAKDKLMEIAKAAAQKEGVQAYWLDFQCRATESGELLDADVHRFCDVVRGATQVVIALNNTSELSKLQWGQRLWTLPEGLLAPDNRIGIYYADENQWSSMRKVEMAGTFWKAMKNGPGDWEAARLLAEHFTGTLQLSRLQLMSTAISALWDRNYTEAEKEPELTMALMGLLHTRIDPIRMDGKWQENATFRNLAKLSLLNDSDRLVERMLCLLPDPHRKSAVQPPSSIRRKSIGGSLLPGDSIFSALRQPDQFETHLWDIHPTCQVVGIAEENWTVVLNEARAIPIRWKAFPKIAYSKSLSWKKIAAELYLRSGLWWIAFGLSLIYTYAPLWAALSEAAAEFGKSLVRYLGIAVGVFFAMGLALAFISPVSLRILYGGVPVRAAPHLVGFEGYMPIKKLEQIVFGNDGGRLTYAPSSTPFSKDGRHPTFRQGEEPAWIKNLEQPQLRDGYRLFTLVDTGSMTVSLFEAKRPPTVALICGREGGMLRAVLCRWKSNGDCLHKETVMRMPTDLYEIASPKGWLKLQLRDD